MLGRARGIDITGLTTPAEYGGFDADKPTYALVNEELAYGSLAVATALSVHCLATSCIAQFGSKAVQDDWLPEMVDGRPVGAFASRSHRPDRTRGRTPRVRREATSTSSTARSG